jgi:type 1 glutamine amidotransferase
MRWVRCGLIAAGMALAGLAQSAAAATAVADCPSARAPYSSDTQLIDLRLDPRANAVLEQQGFLKGLTEFFLSTKPPAFSAIITPRWMVTSGPLASAGLKPDALAALDRALAAIPITDEAATRRCARYDHTPPVLPKPARHPAILVFEKINGFRDDPSVNAAHKAFADMAAKRGWSIAFTDNGAVFNRAQLKNYDAVVWNNVSGDVLTVPQEAAFKAYMAAGGGYAGVHGAGGDFAYVWDWYPDTLIGARFTNHPGNPQFQAAKVVVEEPGKGIAARLPASWTMTEEWYSFAASPRAKGVHVLARLDESSYAPGPKLTMGDHPIAWSHCLGNGRAFYSAIGHRPDSYTEPNSAELLEQGVAWAAGAGDTRCKAGREVGVGR